ncbi:MAG: hypothetical protein IJ574_04210 [Bacilli bacterium]|nr:hypothetical protein [Bacilli bacterium]
MNNISIGDLINVLKPEFINAAIERDKLNEFIKLKKCFGINFSTSKSYDDVKLRYQVDRLDPIPKIIFDRIMNMGHLPECVDIKNGNYVINDRGVQITNQEAFNKQVDYILESDFANNIDCEIQNYQLNDCFINLSIYSNIVHIYLQEFKGDKHLISDFYYRIQQRFYNNCYTYDTTDYYNNMSLQDLLALQIETDILPEYHKDIIERNKSLIKRK